MAKVHQRRDTAKLVEDYFSTIGWKPFSFQRDVWRAYLEGQSGLVHSATGTGKTLAVWMGPLLKWMRENPDRTKWDSKRPPSIRVLWVTPLRALAADTEKSLRQPLEGLQLPWQLESRTGDSKASVKSRQLKKLPTAMVTTPESLSLMLTHQQLLEQFSGVEVVIVDEWHELLGSKRGVQTELALARLRKLNPNLLVWGLTATLGNIEEALQSLVGVDPLVDARIIRGQSKKGLKIESVIPERVERFPWSGHIGIKMAPQVVTLIESVASALVFTNTRSQTEIWYQQLLSLKPDWAGLIAVHHGSLDTSVRQWVEDVLRDGKLRAVVCTSSLDLGVDFSAVDLVIQIGSPKGAARLLQRAGRSGHQPDAVSRLAFVPTNAIELIELAAAQEAIKQGYMEKRPLLQKPLDVLAQHLVTIAIGGGFVANELLNEVRSTVAYRTLRDHEWEWVLDFVVRGGSSLTAYPDFHRVEIVDGRYQVGDRRIIRNHRMNIGTIVSDESMKVKFPNGRTLGTAEESFLSKLKEGDRFLFAGRVVEMMWIRDNVAYVKIAKGKPDTVPRWMGGRMPLSTELSEGMRRKITEASEGKLLGREMKALRSLLEVQERWSAIPSHEELLIEKIKTRGGYQIFMFPFEGRLVHEGLAALLAFRISCFRATTFSMACNDHGFVLQSPHDIDIDQALSRGILNTDRLFEDILKCMNSTEMAKRQFRQIARVAGLIQPGYPGSRKSSGYLQASSNLFFDVFEKYDTENLLLEQSRREVLEFQLEASRLMTALERIEKCRKVIVTPEKVTPFAFPLLVDKLRERISTESLADRVARMQADLEMAASADELPRSNRSSRSTRSSR